MPLRNDFLAQIGRVGMLVSGVCCAVIAVLANLDILLRPFRVEFFLASDLNGYLLVFLIMMALPEVTRQGQHVKVRLFVDLFPAGAKYFGVIQQFFMFVYMTALVWVCADLALASQKQNLISQGFLHTPLFYPQFGMVLGLAMTWVVQLGLLWLAVKGLLVRPSNQEA